MVRRLILLSVALLLVAAGTPDLVHAQQGAVVEAHIHADGTPPDHDHVAEQCATACQIAPAVVPVMALPETGTATLRIALAEAASPQPVRAPPELRPPRRIADRFVA
jgi:hypothetical protein